MLQITRNNNLTGKIEINSEIVVQLSASITIDKENPEVYSSSGVSRTILNTDLYKQNISEIRKAISKFEEEVYTMEDELLLSMAE